MNPDFEMHRTYFGGGHTGFVLLDQADVLESGINIVAASAGRRPERPVAVGQ